MPQPDITSLRILLEVARMGLIACSQDRNNSPAALAKVAASLADWHAYADEVSPPRQSPQDSP